MMGDTANTKSNAMSVLKNLLVQDRQTVQQELCGNAMHLKG